MALPGFARVLPQALAGLDEFAHDLRWSWNHDTDDLWCRIDRDGWERTGNPWIILQTVPRARLEELAADREFVAEFERVKQARATYLADCGCLGPAHTEHGVRIAYFSLEFGLSEALPLYAGGLGVLAGDHLKTASDLGIPLAGVGLLYQEGYFRQLIDADGRQLEAYPFSEPSNLPLEPVLMPDGAPLHVTLELPGRAILLRVWRSAVGRVSLYLLDSNHPLNAPADRGITSKLYDAGAAMRLGQEYVLGVGGWRMLEALGLEPEVCHLNEGHAALLVLERARRCAEKRGLSFEEALWATRPGNLFTTHTPVPAGFDRYSPSVLRAALGAYLPQLGLDLPALLALGRVDGADGADEPFNLTYLALRGCGAANGVSRLHGSVSRRLVRALYPRWPESEVPIGSVTNGIHVPSWDSRWADGLWTRSCGKDRWRGTVESLAASIAEEGDESLWTFAAREREDLIRYARGRIALQLAERGAERERIEAAAYLLDPNVLTIGFARRFTAYKRPNLLLADPERLARMLLHRERPMQLLVAGKAHPNDREGKRLIREWLRFVTREDVRHRAVFLEDYDLSLARELVQGVDLWVNTPRRPMEACGTSGMKVLVNGGLNLSELDGWWAEAYCPECGWALGDGREHAEAAWDAQEAEQLYRLLEEEVAPLFYDRDSGGVPRGWIARVRSSMARLAPQFSSNRMLQEYAERFYLPAADAVRARMADDARLARELARWHRSLDSFWREVHFARFEMRPAEGGWDAEAQVHLGELDAAAVRVELCADPIGDGAPFRLPMEADGEIPGVLHGVVYRAAVRADRPADHFTARVVPWHAAARIPAEARQILWQR